MSTNRYLNAGAPGVGTTVDNMASRVKTHSRLNLLTAPATIQASFNASSIVDNGVGDVSLNLAVSFTDLFYTSMVSADNVSGGIARVYSDSARTVSLYRMIEFQFSAGAMVSVDGVVTSSAHGALA